MRADFINVGDAMDMYEDGHVQIFYSREVFDNFRREYIREFNEWFPSIDRMNEFHPIVDNNVGHRVIERQFKFCEPIKTWFKK